MWHNSRRGFNLIRSRANARSNKSKNIQLIAIAGLILIVSSLAIYGIYSMAQSPNLRKIAKNDVEQNASVDVYTEKDVIEKAEENKEDINEKDESQSLQQIVDETTKEDEEEKENQTTDMRITALGEIMMGGSRWNKNSYSIAYKEIAPHTLESDYTIASLATNITTVEDLSDTKSKYIANESIVNAFSALNIKALNVATDHMLDFSKNMFKTTIDTIKKNDIDVVGLNNDVVYAEKNGIRVGIIGINNVVIGSAGDYINAGMYIYDMGKLQRTIKEARKNADTIIVMTHYGKENVHEVTDVMSWFAKEIIKAGADIVLGGHSLGIYPVEEYNGKLIIYSLGYLMHDTTKEVGKKSAIFDININEKGVINKLSITPTYIKDSNTVKLFKDINQKAGINFLNELKSKSKLSKYSSSVEDDKLVITLN